MTRSRPRPVPLRKAIRALPLEWGSITSYPQYRQKRESQNKKGNPPMQSVPRVKAFYSSIWVASSGAAACSSSTSIFVSNLLVAAASEGGLVGGGGAKAPLLYRCGGGGDLRPSEFRLASLFSGHTFAAAVCGPRQLALGRDVCAPLAFPC